MMSIVVTTHNRPSLLRRALLSILASNGNFETEPPRGLRRLIGFNDATVKGPPQTPGRFKIAFQQSWLTPQQLLESAKAHGNSRYGAYLDSLAREAS